MLRERAGYAELTRRRLWSFGPGTEADLVWAWLDGYVVPYQSPLARAHAAGRKAECAAVAGSGDDRSRSRGP